MGSEERSREIESFIEATAGEKRRQIAELGFTDANIWLGAPAYAPLANALDPEGLGSILETYCLNGALVSHWDSVHISAQDGNLALLDAAGSLPDQVHTVWTGLPTVPREQAPLPGFGRPDGRMRGVRLFPRTHRYQLSQWVVGELCEWCIEHRLPILLWHVEAQWNDIHALATVFPALRIVVETQWQKILYHLRDLFGLMRACPNVSVESSNCIGQDSIRRLVESFGAGRLIFGSYFPVNDPFAAIGTILDADISDEEKALIAGANLRDLIDGAGTG